MRRLAALVLVAALPAVPALAGGAPIYGLWAHPDGPCSREGAADLVPVLLTPRRITFYESACQIVAADATGVGSAVALTVRCSGEGSTWDTAALAMVDIEDRLILYWQDGGVFEGRRCR